ncbi:MAG TPA: NADH-quinone oxidoreductase subunit C [Cyclobacteriaceae bacterium]|nr:NADH-quinone oxidoreductase subunit C [Cyclobacteriaceae bacterium]
MQTEELTTLITSLAPDQKPGISKQYPEFIIPADKIHEVAKTLKENPQTKMDYLFNLTAADRKDGLNVIYHLTSTEYRHIVVLRVILADKENPMVATVSDLWSAAEYLEREVFDLFGIKFENHPDLRRLFLDDEWVGYPLRKDYKDSFIFER